MLQADYIVYHLNYSPENKNAALMARYGTRSVLAFLFF